MKLAIESMLCRRPLWYLRLLKAVGRGNLEKRAFLALVAPGQVVFDIGANRGHFTRLFSLIVGANGSVHAFEPVPGTFSTLSESMAGYPKNFRLNRFAFGENASIATIGVPRGDDGQASLRDHVHGSWESAGAIQRFECEVRKLDDYASDLQRMDFIKCDVEGAELLVLKGGGGALARLKPMLWIECNPDWTRAFGYTPADLVAELRVLGYDRFYLDENQLKPVQDLKNPGGGNLLCAMAAEHESRLGGISRI